MGEKSTLVDFFSIECRKRTSWSLPKTLTWENKENILEFRKLELKYKFEPRACLLSIN